MYVSSVMLLALHQERDQDLGRRAWRPARRSRQPRRARSHLALRPRTRTGQPGLRAAG